MVPLTADLIYLTTDVPGVGGTIKQRPDDFLVEEQPLYQPAGTGEHVMLYVEKRSTTTTDVLRRIAKAFRVGRGDIGYAGLKDKHAVTRQHFSVYAPLPDGDKDALDRLQYANFKVLWAVRHGNKLRRGHLAGNRFVIRIRNVEPTRVVHVKKVLDRLVIAGAPNYIGEQRFGYRQTNHQLGRLFLLGHWQEFLDLLLGQPCDDDSPATRAGREAYERGDYPAALDAWPRHLRQDRQPLDALRQGRSPQQAAMSIDAIQREFLVNSFQSVMFNQVLNRRVREGWFDKLTDGDVAWKHDNKALFTVDAATAELENAPGGRMASLAISPSGPMWGSEMMRASGVPNQWEEEMLAEQSMTAAAFAAPHAMTPGSRRPTRMIIKDADVSGGADEHGPFIRLAFELPPGSFATTLLREIMKTGGVEEAAAIPEREDE